PAPRAAADLRALLPHRRSPQSQTGGQRPRPRHRAPRRPGARRQGDGAQPPGGRRRVQYSPSGSVLVKKCFHGRGRRGYAEDFTKEELLCGSSACSASSAVNLFKTMASERVLLIEDDPSIVAGLELNLALEGYEVLTAGDGERGYRLAVERAPDLIVLDIMLPGMNGLEVLRRLREVDADVPVLILTARSEEADKVLGLTLGADDY